MYAQNHNILEKELIEQAISGNRLALRQIIERTEKLVLHIVCSMVNGKEDREDLSQDVFLKAFRSLHTFRSEAKLSTWIARIAYNTCLNHLQKKRLIFKDINQLAEEIELISQHNPIEQLTQKQVSGILQQAINQLSPLYRTLITLFHISSFSLAEISQITNMPEGTIKSYLHRARKELHQTILINYKSKEAL